jgi:hypothetical protein
MNSLEFDGFTSVESGNDWNFFLYQRHPPQNHINNEALPKVQPLPRLLELGSQGLHVETPQQAAPQFPLRQ